MFRPGPLTEEMAELLNWWLSERETTPVVKTVLSPLAVKDSCLTIIDYPDEIVAKTSSTADSEGHYDGQLLVWDASVDSFTPRADIKVLDLADHTEAGFLQGPDLGKYVGITDAGLYLYALGKAPASGGTGTLTVKDVSGTPSVPNVNTLTADLTTGLIVTAGATGIANLTNQFARGLRTGIAPAQPGVISGNATTWPNQVLGAGVKYFPGLAVFASPGGSPPSADEKVRFQNNTAGTSGTDARDGQLNSTNFVREVMNTNAVVGITREVWHNATVSSDYALGTFSIVADKSVPAQPVKFTFGASYAGGGRAPRIFVGTAAGATVEGGTGTVSGLVFQSGLYISGSVTGGTATITVQDEGSTLSTTCTTLNFVGAGVTATGSGSTITVTVPGGGTGTVTSVQVSGGSTGLTTSGGPITTSGTITLAGTLTVASGGTGGTTAAAGLNNLLPAQSGHAGQFLKTDGSNPSWAPAAGIWAVSSQAANFTAATSPTSYYCSSAAGSITATLPAASGNAGLRLSFTKTSASSSTNLVTIKGNGAEVINATPTPGNTVDLYYQQDGLMLECDGTAWNVVADYRRAHVCVAARSAAQSIGSATPVTILLDTAVVDGLGMFAGSSIVIKRAGRYAIGGYWSMTGQNVQLVIVKPGPVNFLRSLATNASGNSVISNTIYAVMTLAAGDQFYLQGYQYQGGAGQNTGTGVDQPVMSFTEVR